MAKTGQFYLTINMRSSPIPVGLTHYIDDDLAVRNSKMGIGF